MVFFNIQTSVQGLKKNLEKLENELTMKNKILTENNLQASGDFGLYSIEVKFVVKHINDLGLLQLIIEVKLMLLDYNLS